MELRSSGAGGGGDGGERRSLWGPRPGYRALGNVDEEEEEAAAARRLASVEEGGAGSRVPWIRPGGTGLGAGGVEVNGSGFGGGGAAADDKGDEEEEEEEEEEDGFGTGFLFSLCDFSECTLAAPPPSWPASFNESAALLLRQSPTRESVQRWAESMTRGSPVHEASSPIRTARRPRAYSDDAPIVKSRLPLHTADLSDTSWLPAYHPGQVSADAAAASQAAAAATRSPAPFTSYLLERHPKFRKFRSEYKNWRKGASRGAKGEVSMDALKNRGAGGQALPMAAVQPLPVQPLPLSELVPGAREQMLEDLDQGFARLEALKEVHGRKGTGSSFLQTVFNGLNAMSGLVLLATPLVLSETGWLGVPMIVGLTLACIHTLALLNECQAETKCVSFPDVAEAAFGSVGRWLAGVFAYVDLFAMGVGCLIINAKSLSMLATLASGVPVSHLDGLVFTTVLFIPTCCLQDLSTISYLSAFGLLANISTVLLVLCSISGRLSSFSEVRLLAAEHTKVLGNDPIVPLSLILYQFTMHSLFPSLRASMRDPSRANEMSRVVLLTIALMVVIFASACYVCFDTLTEQITNQLGNGGLGLVANTMVFLNAYTKLPLSLFPVCSALVELLPLPSLPQSPGTLTMPTMDDFEGLGNPSSKGFLAGFLTRCAALATTFLVAFACPQFATVVGFCAWMIAPTLAFAIPVACHLRLFWDRTSTLTRAMGCLVIFLSVMGSIVGMTLQIAGPNHSA